MPESARELFDLPPDIAYFNSAYMGAPLRSVRAAADQALDRIAKPWTVSPADFFEPAERARQHVASLLGATTADIALVPSVSYGLGLAAANLPLSRGQRILVLAEQFPSNVYPWQAAAATAGAEVMVVPRPADGDWTPAVLDRIDNRTALAALPHCHWTDGSRLDLVRIGEALRSRGAALALDVTQSLGALELDVRTVQPDFLACAAYKWLLGPYGLGFVYAAPQHHSGVPLEHGWITRRDAEDFAGLVDYRDELQPGARRYDMGERSSFVLLPMLIAALEQILDWTPAATQNAAAARTQRIADALAPLGLLALPPHLRGGHILGARFEGRDCTALVAQLREAGVFVSLRGDTIRIAAHQSTDDADVDRLIEAMQSLLR